MWNILWFSETRSSSPESETAQSQTKALNVEGMKWMFIFPQPLTSQLMILLHLPLHGAHPHLWFAQLLLHLFHNCIASDLPIHLAASLICICHVQSTPDYPPLSIILHSFSGTFFKIEWKFSIFRHLRLSARKSAVPTMADNRELTVLTHQLLFSEINWSDDDELLSQTSVNPDQVELLLSQTPVKPDVQQSKTPVKPDVQQSKTPVKSNSQSSLGKLTVRASPLASTRCSPYQGTVEFSY